MHARATLKGKKTKRVPMATPIREKKEAKERFKHVGFRSVAFLNSLRKHYIVSCLVVVLVVLVFVVLFTPLFNINAYDIVMDKNKGCLTEDSVRKSVVIPHAKVWSYIGYSPAKLYKAHQCLQGVTFSWNPFSFSIMKVIVSSKTPVARVLFTKVDTEDAGLDGKSLLGQQPVGQDILYLTTDGRLINLDESVPLFGFRYVVQRNIRPEMVSISKEDLIVLMQMERYFKDVYNESPRIDYTADRVVRVSSHLADEIILSPRYDSSKQLGSLQALFATSTIDTKKIFSIDVRFGNPVVRFKQ